MILPPAIPRKRSQPPLEKVSLPYEGSILVRHFDESHRNTRPYWHFHPELELVYVKGGSGKRHIGSHLSYFKDGELILIGSNLPHQGFMERLNGNESETVIQMLPDFLGKGSLQIPEMKTIASLFERAKKGLVFGKATQRTVGCKILQLCQKDSFGRMLTLLDILRELSLTHDYKVLNADGFLMVASPQDNDRLNKILNHVKEQFTDVITLPEVCDLVGMTEPAFCRYFKKITAKTFTQFLNEYRLVHASKLLAEKQISIAEVCYQSGFSNYSHFVAQFKLFSGKSPSNYRKEIQEIF
ncbi:MAG: AraC family transcriptional regulator [Bacteroidota bacterium]